MRTKEDYDAIREAYEEERKSALETAVKERDRKLRDIENDQPKYEQKINEAPTGMEQYNAANEKQTDMARVNAEYQNRVSNINAANDHKIEEVDNAQMQNAQHDASGGQTRIQQKVNIAQKRTKQRTDTTQQPSQTQSQDEGIKK